MNNNLIEKYIGFSIHDVKELLEEEFFPLKVVEVSEEEFDPDFDFNYKNSIVCAVYNHIVLKIKLNN